MKIRSVVVNSRKRAFELRTYRGWFSFPFAKSEPPPSASDPVVEAWIDPELASEAIVYRLASGKEGCVHVEQALDYNRDPHYLRDMLLHRLTAEAQDRLAASSLSKREIIRRLGTSPAQFYRLLDTTNYRKSVDQMLFLLQALDCDVDLVVRGKRA